ncbi:squalene/phytoene synthase family protein [Nocardioides sp. CER19]|uniref:phytoene/squalene synthase family protein n=1 Tax=Nocardioides sp. CER19 TaxID=3038538 RepID=UPI00244A0389|nr:squalene/phytoene synthase family protein [Nocardioides sp. CER19]MDH2416242.1 squalene/phytoene synthase family protein [Nocardioides sp. CER19]
MSLLYLRTPTTTTAADRYDAVADESAALVIRRYSSSFGTASRLLGPTVRPHVRNVYALVRVADEIVDAPRPGAVAADRRRLLGALEEETLAAMERGHSANLVVHAFARTAATCGIEPDLVVPFFGSMRVDLDRTEHDAESFADYIYGSAEVVGLMCLRAFVHHRPAPAADYQRLASGARRLGAGFQKVNFLRDLAADHHDLSRCYFPGIDPTRLTEAQRDALLDDIDADLLAATPAIAGLPADSRRAVAAAHALFAELARRLRTTPVEEIRSRRVRVPGRVKARVVARCLVRGVA